jgi:glucan phosphoethanolaminetransferase (alkaline phosphatase superfamily)
MAIPLILTRKPIDSMQMSSNEPSILRVMQEAGFQTRWISNQMPLGKLDSPVSAIAVEAQQVTFVNHEAASTDSSFDEATVKSLSDTIHKDQGNLFIVLHMMGSHMLYDRRYPPSFKHFVPTFADSTSDVDDQQKMNNSYDNTILYTDHVLAKVIRTLEASDAITAMFFASDHGETLPTPTCSYAGHGIGSKYDFEIPALFWFSNAYASAYPAELSAIRSNASQPTLSGNIFESVVDMTDVTFPGHDPSWSLFSDKWQYHSRIINSYAEQMNFDGAKFDNKCETVLSLGKQ